ncbi:hypothetical protein Ocin01_00061 [Orchesella cincta]|uniref:Uncharacterized protein n=1 Tax=Orchesella cincta TaxID=48709 RepID=A0A1D2NNC9_ORCCI|nr:hypothetical protein Ocin01_00061 [Orchesella cincta]
MEETPRSHAEQRKSQSWTATGKVESSIISVNSLEFPRQNNSYPSEPGSRTSVTSPESGIDGEAESSDETAPPPVPPKQRDKHSDNKPPTPPPKPPMRYFRDVPQP